MNFQSNVPIASKFTVYIKVTILSIPPHGITILIVDIINWVVNNIALPTSMIFLLLLLDIPLLMEPEFNSNI